MKVYCTSIALRALNFSDSFIDRKSKMTGKEKDRRILKATSVGGHEDWESKGA